MIVLLTGYSGAGKTTAIKAVLTHGELELTTRDEDAGGSLPGVTHLLLSTNSTLTSYCKCVTPGWAPTSRSHGNHNNHAPSGARRPPHITTTREAPDLILSLILREHA